MERELTARGAATRARIVEGGAALIRERGIAAVAMDDIRAATSTSKSQLFHYFPGGRTELLAAVAQHEADRVLDDQRPPLDDLSTPESWRAWQALVVERYTLQGEHCPLAALTSELGKSSPEARAIVRDLMVRWLALLAAGVRAFRPDTADPDETAGIILAAVQGGVNLLMSTGDARYLETALEAATERLLERSAA
jgi:AcrR family transcriptional regulator